MFALISLKLNYLTILRMFYHSTIACKFLKKSIQLNWYLQTGRRIVRVYSFIFISCTLVLYCVLRSNQGIAKVMGKADLALKSGELWPNRACALIAGYSAKWTSFIKTYQISTHFGLLILFYHSILVFTYFFTSFHDFLLVIIIG